VPGPVPGLRLVPVLVLIVRAAVVAQLDLEVAPELIPPFVLRPSPELIPELAVELTLDLPPQLVPELAAERAVKPAAELVLELAAELPPQPLSETVSELDPDLLISGEPCPGRPYGPSHAIGSADPGPGHPLTWVRRLRG